MLYSPYSIIILVLSNLITGGTGKTGLALANLLHQANYSALIASRSGQAPEPFNAVKFDWFDAATFENPFNLNLDIAEPVDHVYIIAPPGRIDGVKAMKNFIDLAVSKGVKQFVLVFAGQISPDDAIISHWCDSSILTRHWRGLYGSQAHIFRR